MFWKWKPLFWCVSFLGIRTLMDRPDSHSWFSSTSTRVVSFRCIWPSMAVFKAWRDQENHHVSSIMPTDVTDFTTKISGKLVENGWKWLKKGVPHVPSTFHPRSIHVRFTGGSWAASSSSETLPTFTPFRPQALAISAYSTPRNRMPTVHHGAWLSVHNVHSSQAIPFGDRLQCLCSARCRQSCHRTTSNRLGRVDSCGEPTPDRQTARPPMAKPKHLIPMRQRTGWCCVSPHPTESFGRPPWSQVASDGTGWNWVEKFKVDRLVVCTTL